MNNFWLYGVRGLLLLAAMALTSYVVSTPGDQILAASLGGAAGMLSVTLQSFEAKR